MNDFIPILRNQDVEIYAFGTAIFRWMKNFADNCLRPKNDGCRNLHPITETRSIYVMSGTLCNKGYSSDKRHEADEKIAIKETIAILHQTIEPVYYL